MLRVTLSNQGNGATSEVLRSSESSSQYNEKEVTVYDSEELKLAFLCSTFWKRVGEFMQTFEIRTSEVKCFKALLILKPKARGDAGSALNRLMCRLPCINAGDARCKGCR